MKEEQNMTSLLKSWEATYIYIYLYNIHKFIKNFFSLTYPMINQI